MKVGFVGLGNMGNPMATNLVRAGHELDRPRPAAGGRHQPAGNGCELGRHTQPVRPRQRRCVYFAARTPGRGGGGSWRKRHPGRAPRAGDVYMDLSTNSPTTAIRRIHDVCAEQGVNVLDSPVSGGVYGAAAATLAVMVGGDEAIFNRMKPTLDAIGSHVVYCGPIGNGMVCKICNNTLGMGIGVLMTEVLTLGVKAGVDLAVLADVIANSSGGNRRLVEKFPRYLFKGNFEPGFATALAAKDVRLGTDLAREYGMPMELANLVDQRHVEALHRGWGPEDSDAVSKIQEEKAGVQLRLPED